MAAGIAYVPEDRAAQGLFARRSVEHNLTAASLGELSGRCGWLNRRRARGLAARWIGLLGILTAGPSAPVHHLSGGNQQKVMLARWLAREARVLILNRPTAGVDVAARAEIHERLNDWAARGISVMVISDDLLELVQITHRILLMHHGRIVDELPTAACDEDGLASRLEALP
jgi:simple sugar transport system ATP-binding protein